MGFLPCGQVIGRIHDIPTCKELIERIMNEAEQAVASVDARFAG
jgi:nitronate monooxygenase